MRACHLLKYREKYLLYPFSAIIIIKPKNSDLTPRHVRQMAA